VFHQSLGAQSVEKHRALYQTIENKVSTYRTTQANREALGLEDRSVESGWIQAYCDGNEIRKIFEEDDGETFTGTRSFYFDHDSVFFVYRHDGHGEMTATSGPYPKRTEIDDERLYFTDGRLVRWLGNKNKPMDITSDSAKRRAEEYLTEAREYHDMMPACKPKPRTMPVDTTNADKAVASIRAIYDVIERERPTYHHATATLDTLGIEPKRHGTIDAYCHDGAVRVMVVTQPTSKDTYYYDRESMVFLFRQHPNGGEERFYFSGPKLVRWLNDKNQPLDVQSPAALQLAKKLNNDESSYTIWMRGCGHW